MRLFIKKILSPFLKKASAIYLSKKRKYTYKNITVWVEPGIFPPFITISTKLLLKLVDSFNLKNKTLLELGCGCGIIAILAAKKGAEVTASDINLPALNALKKNIVLNKCSLAIIESDLFNSLQNKTYDYIIINPPYYPKKPETPAEHAWFCGEGFEYFEKLFMQLPDFLTANNNTYLILSEDCEIDTITAISKKNNIILICVSQKKVFFETNYIFKINRMQN